MTVSELETLRSHNARLTAENAALRKRCCEQPKADHPLSQDECVVSVAFDDSNGRRDARKKYESAVQTFLEPFQTDYTSVMQRLSSPQPCRFLLWVTFVGGRLPD